MVEVYDSHEQGERVKSWLRENGSAILMGLVLAFGGLFGFKQWQIWELSNAQAASAEYATMQTLLLDNQLDSAVANYETLKSEHAESAYTPMAALQMAKARIEAGQSDLAVSQLEFAMANAEPAVLQVIARERLARLKLDQGDPEAAIKLLDGAPSDLGFEARFAEIRGDIQQSMGNTEQAIAEYSKAIELSEEGVGYQAVLEMKIEALGVTGGEATDS